jgi:hypothetical protein
MLPRLVENRLSAQDKGPQSARYVSPPKPHLHIAISTSNTLHPNDFNKLNSLLKTFSSTSRELKQALKPPMLKKDEVGYYAMKRGYGLRKSNQKEYFDSLDKEQMVEKMNKQHNLKKRAQSLQSLHVDLTDLEL